MTQILHFKKDFKRTKQWIQSFKFELCISIETLLIFHRFKQIWCNEQLPFPNLASIGIRLIHAVLFSFVLFPTIYSV